MNLDPTVLSAIVIALGSLLVALVTSRQNKQGARATTALNERVVDREDFDKVMTRMTESLDRADKKIAASDERIEKLEQRLEEEVELRKTAESRAVAAEERALAADKRATAAEERAKLLERRVTLLEMILSENKIPVPRVSPD